MLQFTLRTILSPRRTRLCLCSSEECPLLANNISHTRSRSHLRLLLLLVALERRQRHEREQGAAAERHHPHRVRALEHHLVLEALGGQVPVRVARGAKPLVGEGERDRKLGRKRRDALGL